MMAILAAAGDGSSSNTIVLLLVGLFGGGGVVGLGTLWQTRGKAKADATVTIGGAYNGLLDRYIKELETLSSKVDTLSERVATLEGKLDRTEHERDWWKSRAERIPVLCPSYLQSFVKSTVRIGTLMPTPRVSVPQMTFKRPRCASCSISTRYFGKRPAWCSPIPDLSHFLMFGP